MLRHPARGRTAVPRALTLLVACVVALAFVPSAASAKSDPRLTRAFYADSASSAAVAAKGDRRFSTLARTPQAYWATDHLPVSKVKKAVRSYAQRAVRKKRTPVVAVYAIPARDCGQHSAGSFDAPTYRRWVSRLAAGLKGTKAIAVLEPDALAMLGQCDAQGDRTGLLRYATTKLKRAGVWVYIDAGHSSWTAPAVMAERLRASGITSARGFSTNVANFRSTADEVAYGNEVVAQLTAQGVRGKKFVVETARNGAATAAGDFCNPVGARVGSKPRMVRQGSLDAYLWVKHPGESDGPCNGGPNAGSWWAAGALALLGR
ncbi:glycoside hydrolase family 6 protein [Aeromicrobium fastidiosum]|uniref:glycoside hydrolase family 6 protein n=1 Tax=Aeromicrobium fastidiosum TaxID=52699 RepID=UPI0020232211|nr:glycoside hydrolase family 6 protein [Aeromicrobium fastidiosum]MCL8250630.1 glycoside hydrolase family 6 protein [Aeromicrobium fastidiosum]